MTVNSNTSQLFGYPATS